MSKMLECCTWLQLVRSPEEKELICSIHPFPWYSLFQHNWFLAVNMLSLNAKMRREMRRQELAQHTPGLWRTFPWVSRREETQGSLGKFFKQIKILKGKWEERSLCGFLRSVEGPSWRDGCACSSGWTFHLFLFPSIPSLTDPKL